MKTDFSKLPPEEIEARITTMLMGEMSADEARELMDFVSGDAELLRLHDELKATISLVAEVSSATEQPKLSGGRREALLQMFKTVTAPGLEQAETPNRNWAQWAAMAAMVGLLLGGTMFVFQSSTPTRHMRVALIEQAAEKQREELLMGGRADLPSSKADSYQPGAAEPRSSLSGAPDEPRLDLSQYNLKGMTEQTAERERRDSLARSATTKIELPAISESGASPVTQPEQQSAFQVAQNEAVGRGFIGGYGGGRFGGVTGGYGGAKKPNEAKPVGDKKDSVGFTTQTASGLEERNYDAFGAGAAAGKNFGLYYDKGEVVNGLADGIANGPVQNVAPALHLPAATRASEPNLATDDSTRGSAVAGGVVGTTEGLESLKRKGEQPVMLGVELKQQARGERLVELSKKSESLPQLQEQRDLDRRENAGRKLAEEAESTDKESRRKTALAAVEEYLKAKRGARELRVEVDREDIAARKPAVTASIPQPEILTAENAFSTFSLNVSDVSFKLAAASLEKGLMPDATTVRSEEFINAFDYRDPEPQGAPVGFVWERARYPFAQDRDLVRFSVKTAASGREAGRPLNLVLLLDSSGSMERADRVRILQECLKTLAAQLRPEDTVSVVAFARTARLWVDGLPGSQASELPQRVGNLTPEGGTNLEEAMKVAYETARKHFNATGVNRVVLLTDGAANLGDVEPESLKRKVEEERKRGVALDCFGIGWEGLNDQLLETMSRNGDGRYGFVNTPEAAASEFAGQLAGALHVAASDVKVQVEWNPKRVTAYRQIGYAKHQLTKEQFRDNTVDAAELGAAEAGNALYVVQVNAAGEGPLGMVRVRFKVPGTNDYREHAWTVDYDGAAKRLENSDYAMRLSGTASAFSEWLVSSPYASEVTTDRLLAVLSGVPEHFAPDPRPKKLEWMIRQAKSLTGK